MKTYYTTAEVAALLRVHRSTVVRWIDEGRVEAMKTPGGMYRIPASEVERITESRGE